ncbi:MAG: response regulator transcription factor [Promicromonosporaceae bacterium]|nr:response regulator transcription factor [Promicromonosporaceae bacterium]
MIRIIIVDDEAFIREAAAALLGREGSIEVVGLAGSGAEAIDLARDLRPDVVLSDVRMPEMDGIELAERLAQLDPPIPVVLVTSHPLPGVLQRALEAGVRGFMAKDSVAVDLAQTIGLVAAGERFVDPELAAAASRVGDNPLSEGEQEVLAAAADGSPLVIVADRLSLSRTTVRNRVSSLVAKLAVTNRHEAAHLARERGWI